MRRNRTRGMRGRGVPHIEDQHVWDDYNFLYFFLTEEGNKSVFTEVSYKV